MKSRINLRSQQAFARVCATFGMLALASVVMSVAVSTAHAASSPVFLLIDNESGYLKNGDPETDIYVNFTHKINDRYSITPEMNNIVYYRRDVPATTPGGKATKEVKPHLTHDLIRITVSDNALGMVGGFKLSAAYQYVPPTDPTLQQSGAIGALYYRPAITRTVGPVDFLLRNRFGLYLQRSGYQLNNPEKAGNPLYDNLMEFNASGSPGGNFGLSLYWADRHTYVMSGYGKNFTRWAGRFYQELEVNYTVDKLAKTNFALVLANDSRYGKKADKTLNIFKPYAKTNTMVDFRISKTWD